MELCQIVQEFLYEKNKPPEGSFFDGMLRQRAAVEHERKVGSQVSVYMVRLYRGLWMRFGNLICA